MRGRQQCLCNEKGRFAFPQGTCQLTSHLSPVCESSLIVQLQTVSIPHTGCKLERRLHLPPEPHLGYHWCAGRRICLSCDLCLPCEMHRPMPMQPSPPLRPWPNNAPCPPATKHRPRYSPHLCPTWSMICWTISHTDVHPVPSSVLSSISPCSCDHLPISSCPCGWGWQKA